MNIIKRQDNPHHRNNTVIVSIIYGGFVSAVASAAPLRCSAVPLRCLCGASAVLCGASAVPLRMPLLLRNKQAKNE